MSVKDADAGAWHSSRNPEGRKRRDGPENLSKGNERSFPLQRLETLVESGHGDQCTVHTMIPSTLWTDPPWCKKMM